MSNVSVKMLLCSTLFTKSTLGASAQQRTSHSASSRHNTLCPLTHLTFLEMQLLILQRHPKNGFNDFSEQNPSPAAGAVASLYYSLSLSSAAGLPDFVALPDLAETHLNSHHTHIFTNLILSCRAYRAVAGQTTQCLRPVCAREGN